MPRHNLPTMAARLWRMRLCPPFTAMHMLLLGLPLAPGALGAEESVSLRGSQPQGGEVSEVSVGYVFQDPVRTESGTRSEETTILLALGVLTGGFWVLMLSVSCYMRFWRRRSKKGRQIKKSINSDDIEKRFPTGHTEDCPTCVVCLSTVEADETCRTTQCGHTFHADCLEAWWLHKPRRTLLCPICRTKQKKKKDQAKKAADGIEERIPVNLEAESEEQSHDLALPEAEEGNQQAEAGDAEREVARLPHIPTEVSSPAAPAEEESPALASSYDEQPCALTC